MSVSGVQVEEKAREGGGRGGGSYGTVVQVNVSVVAGAGAVVA